MITSSGAICDVCGHYILPIDPDEIVNSFTVKGIDGRLYCDNACKQKLIKCGNDWKQLPEGPLRKVFEQAEAKLLKEKEGKSGTE